MMDKFEASREVLDSNHLVIKYNDDGTTSYVSEPLPGGIRRRTDKGFIFSGQPGIGKTCFLSYVLVERLLKARPTVLQVVDKDAFLHVLFNESGTHLVSSYNPSCTDSAIWALTDQTPRGVASNFDHHNWLVVTTSSPRRENYHHMKKHYSMPLYYMPVWTWEEIAAASSVPHIVICDIANSNTGASATKSC
jgi:hypothetical protein